MAQEHFTFLRDCAAPCQLILGDARLSLEFEADNRFDVLVLDAFAGDAIPIHLLTVEAFEIYRRHLQEDGILACHISNLHFDLKPVVAGLADNLGMDYRFLTNAPEPSTGTLQSVWAFLSHSHRSLEWVIESPTNDKPQRFIKWTDKRSNLLEVLQ
jgi:spermidine synthase